MYVLIHSSSRYRNQEMSHLTILSLVVYYQEKWLDNILLLARRSRCQFPMGNHVHRLSAFNFSLGFRAVVGNFGALRLGVCNWAYEIGPCTENELRKVPEVEQLGVSRVHRILCLGEGAL